MDCQERHKAFKDLTGASIFTYQRVCTVPTYLVIVTMSVFLINIMGKCLWISPSQSQKITGFKADSAHSICKISAFY